ncbi:MAG TPA: hypothetical protein VK913_01420, partial [Erythrobacter sp.]|nr:hypothetical protein [Erythrobacter sp.]
GLALMLAGLAYGGLKVWQMGRRGWKDHLWIWEDANRAARFIAIIMGAQAVGRWAWYGMNDLVVTFLVVGAILVPVPYIAYTIGRLLGIRDRTRYGSRLS